MTFAAETDKVFRSMGYTRQQIPTDFLYMMGIKPPPIFGFRFATNLAVTFSFFPSNLTGILPFPIIRSFATSPIGTVLTTNRFGVTRSAKFSMPSYQSATNWARFSVFSFLVSSMFQPIFLWISGILRHDIPTIKMCTTSFTAYGIVRTKLPTINTGVLVSFLPTLGLLFCPHKTILTYCYLKVKPRYRGKVWFGG